MGRKALIVGIDDYKSCPLSGCCNDAQAIADILSSNEDGSANFSIKLKKNVNSKGELRSLIIDCFKGNEDISLFYYSGHGYIDNYGGYLITPDFKQNDYGVSLQDILNIANNSKCREKIIILDSCFSGFMGSIVVSDQNTSVISEGVTILTASRSDETSLELNGHGLFTSLLVDALQGGAADILGNITPSGIYSYIDKALGPWEQRPVFKTNVYQFVSLRQVIPQVSLSTIKNICTYFSKEDDKLQLDPSFEPTNSPGVLHEIFEPYANSDNTRIFNELQKLESIGLIVPVEEQHMYFAAMHSKSCELTSIGKQYWRLVKEKRI